jgi:GT2 family glycosyltransferase
MTINEEKVSIHLIVLTWNNVNILEKCLESIEKIDRNDFKVSIVDNCSSDNTTEMINEKFPHYSLIRNIENLRYAGGYNSALNQITFSDDEYVILLNDDTIVSRDFIDELVFPLLNDQKSIISVPKILYASNINKVWYAGGNVNFWKGIISHVGIRDFDGPKYSFINETDYATGCCFCIKYSDFKKLNYFDLGFYMYCEDVDLSLRAKALNRTIIYNPKSVILHRVSQSLGEHSFQKNKLKLQSQLKLFWKHATGIQLLSISLYWILIHLPYQFIRWLYLRNK